MLRLKVRPAKRTALCCRGVACVWEWGKQRMNPEPIKILNECFGYDDFRENQREIIEAVLDGEDAFVLMPPAAGSPSVTRFCNFLSPLINCTEKESSYVSDA